MSTTCPGCSSEDLCGEYHLDDCPVVLNYRYVTAVEADAVPRGTVFLKQCSRCGLVFNAQFDDAATLYDSQYENTQTCSNAFRAHLDTIASHLTDEYCRPGASVVEVGCGKGDFLRMLCQRSGSFGHGYDTTCELEGWTDDRSVCFHQRYLNADEISEPVALIVCRHVVEHVTEIGAFLRLLYVVSKRGGNAPVFIETPDWDWIVEHSAHWDIFYEHCNYFSKQALSNLAINAGFKVCRHENLFQGQYQGLELLPSDEPRAMDSNLNTKLDTIGPRLMASRNGLTDRIVSTMSDASWAIWGAGAKGVCLANAVRSCPPDFLIDANPRKQGCFVPGTKLEIVAPDDQRLRELDIVLVANPNYVPEIQQFVDDRALPFRLAPL